MRKDLNEDSEVMEEDAATLVGQTPASVIDGLACKLAILGYDDHPLMAAFEKTHSSFLAALLPDAGAPILDSFYLHPYDGNDCHARFATSAYAFKFCYQTS